MSRESALLRGFPVAVGDTIYVTGVNARGRHYEHEVVSIDPKRLKYEQYGRATYVNLETGGIDDFSHAVTAAEIADEAVRRALSERLGVFGLQLRWSRPASKIPTAKLAAIVELLEET